MRIAALALLWLVSVAAAFYLGGSYVREAAPGPGGGRNQVRTRNESAASAAPRLAPGAPRPAVTPSPFTTPETAASAAPRLAPGTPRPADTPRLAPGTPRPAGTPSPAATPEPAPLPEAAPLASLPPFTLAGITDGDAAMALLRRHVAAYLAGGKQGHLDLLRFLDENVTGNEDLKRLTANDRDSARLIYSWLRFLVHRERQVVELLATTYETMATDPAFFEGFDVYTLEFFTDALPMVLPGALGEEELDPFRAWARQILDTDLSRQPEGLRSARRHLVGALATWAPNLSPEEAVRQMREGKLQGRAALSALLTLEPAQLADLDLGAILASGVRQGDSQVIDSLDELPLSHHHVDALDEEILGVGNRPSWVIQGYLLATKRHSWPAAQPVLERGLALGRGRSSPFALALLALHPRPPADYIRWVIDTHDLEASTVKSLQGGFDLR